MARIPAVKAQAHLSDGTLGVALFAVPAGLVIGAAVAERLVDRVGSARVAWAFGVGSCLVCVTPGFAKNLPELMKRLADAGARSIEARPAGAPRTGAPSPRQVRRLVIALGVLAICGLAGEGAIGDWSAVYLRDNLATSAGFAALGFAAFSVTMTIGRAVGDRLISRFGTVRLVRDCGLIAAAGLAAGLASGNSYAAVTGFAVFGAGMSVVVPQVFAAGGRANPARPGSGLARVVGLGYVGMTAGPAVIGAVASRVGLHLAFGIPVLLALWIAVAAPVLGGRAGTAYGRHMNDKEILERINGLIETEHELRSELAAGTLSSEQERERLRSAEEALDQCWDLLRQRRARREFGEDPEGAAARPSVEVEGYQQ